LVVRKPGDAVARISASMALAVREANVSGRNVRERRPTAEDCGDVPLPFQMMVPEGFLAETDDLPDHEVEKERVRTWPEDSMETMSGSSVPEKANSDWTSRVRGRDLAKRVHWPRVQTMD